MSRDSRRERMFLVRALLYGCLVVVDCCPPRVRDEPWQPAVTDVFCKIVGVRVFRGGGLLSTASRGRAVTAGRDAESTETFPEGGFLCVLCVSSVERILCAVLGQAQGMAQGQG